MLRAELELRIRPRGPQVGRDLAHQLDRGDLALGGLLQEEERRNGFSVHAQGTEEWQAFRGKASGFRELIELQVVGREVEGNASDVEDHALRGEGVADLVFDGDRL